MYITDELHLRPMQGRRKRHFGAGWRSRRTVSGGGSWLHDSKYQVSQSPDITKECQPTPESWTLKRLQTVSFSSCLKIRWCKAQRQRVATQLCDESGPQGTSAFCSSPATEGFPIASTSIRLDGSYPHAKSPLPWLGMSFWEGKISKEIMKNNHGSKQRQCWEVLGVLWFLCWAAARAPESFLQLLLAKPRKHLKRRWLRWDETHPQASGYVISGYRAHKKVYGTRAASASGNPLLFQWQRPMLAHFQSWSWNWCALHLLAKLTS